MSISLDDNLVTLKQAAARLPGRTHISSIWRWSRKGVRGVYLETIVIAGRRYTSVEALEAFVAATTAAANGQPQPDRTEKKRQRAIEDAERLLDQAGITNRPADKKAV